MAWMKVLADTSVLIEYYRKTDKANSYLFKLLRDGCRFAISAVTKYETYAGATEAQLEFWDRLLAAIDFIRLDEVAVNAAVAINAALKRKRKQVALADLFIAGTATAAELPIATLNRKHFERIDALTLVD